MHFREKYVRRDNKTTSGRRRPDVTKERDVCMVTGSYRSSQLGVLIRKER